jgi:hypothetical protein
LAGPGEWCTIGARVFLRRDSMGVHLTVFFSDGYKKIFICEGDEDATMKREDLFQGGHEEKREDKHIFYPASAIVKIVLEQV